MQFIANITSYYFVNNSYVLMQFYTHFLMSIYGVLFASIIAIPIGIFIAKKHSLAPWIIGFANILQTIPSLAMLSIMLLVLGLGPITVIATVFVYSLLPIIKNTYTAITNVNKFLIDIANGMGMSKWQILLKIKLPLSVSIIMAGIRNALVVAIGISAIGTFIGAGGLGDIISRGINVANGGYIVWAGAIPTAFMAIISDLALSFMEKRLDPTNNKSIKRIPYRN